jgi:hypothetical protein
MGKHSALFIFILKLLGNKIVLEVLFRMRIILENIVGFLIHFHFQKNFRKEIFKIKSPVIITRHF